MDTRVFHSSGGAFCARDYFDFRPVFDVQSLAIRGDRRASARAAKDRRQITRTPGTLKTVLDKTFEIVRKMDKKEGK